MNAMRAGLAALVAIAVAGCSTGGDSGRADTVEPTGTATTTSAPATPSPTTAAARQATKAQVKAALLSVTDLPTGWSREKEDEDDDDDFSKGCKPLAALDDAFGADSQTPEAEVGFSRDELGPFVAEGVTSLPDAAEVSASMKTLKKALTACSSFSYKDDEGKEQEVEIAPMSFPRLGDESLAARMSITFEGGVARITLLAVRVRNHAVLLLGMGVTTVFGGERLAPAEFERIARAAVRKADRRLP